MDNNNADSNNKQTLTQLYLNNKAVTLRNLLKQPQLTLKDVQTFYYLLKS